MLADVPVVSHGHLLARGSVHGDGRPGGEQVLAEDELYAVETLRYPGALRGDADDQLSVGAGRGAGPQAEHEDSHEHTDDGGQQSGVRPAARPVVSCMPPP